MKPNLLPRRLLPVAAIAGGTLIVANHFDTWNPFGGAAPQEHVAADAQATINNITLPGDTLLVQGEGTMHGEIRTKTQVHIPLVGDGFNNFVNGGVKWLTHHENGVVRAGNVQILAKGISLSEYHVPGSVTPGIAVNVATKNIYRQPASMTTQLDGDKKPMIDHSQGPAASSNNDGPRQDAVNNYTDNAYADRCSVFLRPNMEKSAKLYGAAIVRKVGEMLAKDDPNSDSRKVGRYLVAMANSKTAPPKVNFINRSGDHGGDSIVPANQVSFADQQMQSPGTIAAELNAKPKNVEVAPGECRANEHAVQQMIQNIDPHQVYRKPAL